MCDGLHPDCGCSDAERHFTWCRVGSLDGRTSLQYGVDYGDSEGFGKEDDVGLSVFNNLGSNNLRSYYRPCFAY